jgi:hypothetical protein
MKLIPETIYRVVNDDGTEVHPAMAQKVNDIVKLMKDAKVLGETSPVNNNVGIRIASAILSNYELRKKRPSKNQENNHHTLIVFPPEKVKTESAYADQFSTDEKEED